MSDSHILNVAVTLEVFGKRKLNFLFPNTSNVTAAFLWAVSQTDMLNISRGYVKHFIWLLGLLLRWTLCGLGKPTHTVSDQVNLQRPTAFRINLFLKPDPILFWFLFYSLLLKGQRQQAVFHLRGFSTSGITYIRFFSEHFFSSERLCCQSCSTFRSSIRAPLTYVLMCVHRLLRWEGWAL